MIYIKLLFENTIQFTMQFLDEINIPLKYVVPWKPRRERGWSSGSLGFVYGSVVTSRSCSITRHVCPPAMRAYNRCKHGFGSGLLSWLACIIRVNISGFS